MPANEYVSSRRQYKVKLEEWGMRKYLRAPNALSFLTNKDKRKRDLDMDTILELDEAPLDHERVQRSEKRIKSLQGVLPTPSAGQYNAVSVMVRC